MRNFLYISDVYCDLKKRYQRKSGAESGAHTTAVWMKGQKQSLNISPV